MHGGQEGRGGRSGAAVVRHLQEAGVERRPPGRDRLLGRVLEVSGEQSRLPSPLQAQRQ
jgi:hypothetical protein